jgi:hypothetical protein
MASIAMAERPGVADVLTTLLSEHGSSSHPYLGAPRLLDGDEAARNLADAVHFLCLGHGRYPGVVDHAAGRVTHPAARHWILKAATGFAAERAFLTKLVVAAGPLPSTPGQARSEAAVAAQTHALATLAQSERNGTALGAAIALVLDWRRIRRVLDVAGQRFGVDPVPLDLPTLGESLEIAAASASTPAVERALAFGAQQLLIQQRGLWDLLETREGARDSSLD